MHVDAGFLSKYFLATHNIQRGDTKALRLSRREGAIDINIIERPQSRWWGYKIDSPEKKKTNEEACF